jgi:hypothetical protein
MWEIHTRYIEKVASPSSPHDHPMTHSTTLLSLHLLHTTCLFMHRDDKRQPPPQPLLACLTSRQKTGTTISRIRLSANRRTKSSSFECTKNNTIYNNACHITMTHVRRFPSTPASQRVLLSFALFFRFRCR